jgi:hypothetical protein
MRVIERYNCALYLWRAAKNRARKRGVLFTIASTDIAIPTHCPVLGIPLDSRDHDHAPSLDEIVPGLGYTVRNVCVISGRANRIKSDATLLDLQAIESYVRYRSRIQNIPLRW